jgi:integrase/recombinase XerD
MQRKWPIEPFTPDEFEALIAICNINTSSGLRDRALICLLGGAGLRLGEALSLLERDVDFKRGAINVRRGKGSKQRIVSMQAAHAARVEVWANHRRDRLGLGARGPLICTYSHDHGGKTLRQPEVSLMLRRRAAAAGIMKRCHPHGLRHSYVSWLAKAGTPIHVIRSLLGHASISTTNLYLSIVDDRDGMEAAHRLDMIWPEQPSVPGTT